MMPWNRKEIWMGSDMRKFSQIRDLLAHSQIEYTYDAKASSWSGGRGLNGAVAGMTRAGEAQAASTYYVYVHRYDYDKARVLLRNL